MPQIERYHMKTQNVYNVVVTENVNVKDATTGQIEKIRKNILFSGVVAAYDSDNAKLQATQKALKTAAGKTADMEEVAAIASPFCC